MVFQTGISRLGSFENTPIVVDNMMYVTTPYNTAMAYDLDTGKQVWRYEHKLGTTIFCCGPNNRGVAIHGAPRLHGHPGRPPDRPRPDDRRSGLGHRSRRPGLRLQHHRTPRSSSATT